MKSTTACPQTEELRQLLSNSLPDERQQECTEHMDNCPCCQARLESVATEGSNLSAVVRGLRDVGQSGAYEKGPQWTAGSRRMERLSLTNCLRRNV